MAHPMAAPRPLSDLPDAQLARVRAVAADVDDTLTVGGRLVPPVLEQIAALGEAGVRVILVTGRPAGHTVGLITYLPGLELAIAENGGVVLSPEGAALRVGAAAADLRVRLDACEREILLTVHEARLTGDRFARLTDCTFHVRGLSDGARAAIDAIATVHGFTTIASSIHVHVLEPGVSKGATLEAVCAQLGLDARAGEVATIGDSMTDAPLFERARFPLSVGVANIAAYLPRLPQAPAWITAEPEGHGFIELARRVRAARRTA